MTTDSQPPGATDQALGITPMIPALAKGGINTGPNATEPPFLLLGPFGFANLFGGSESVFQSDDTDASLRSDLLDPWQAHHSRGI